ncbi:hypothetical protein JD844_013735 [Phrynosoma platyrhinos]|uniref:Uncharacterized protein n=1 Tax=Phrynosoma platyrhinos TaxID=52577 RepID=A0ABQ7TMH8_PHRPL|nr:hypothetical protein JD844_013735 [Phrynosoma platyrhinos]
MEKTSEGPGKIPRIVQVMCFNGLPRQVNQQPDIGMNQQWEAQWQEFLRSAHAEWGNPQLMDAMPWDDTKAFLSAFEQVAEACRWPKEEWVGRLLPAMRGGVEQYFCRLDPRERQDYQKVKVALLRADAFRMESKRQHFRQCCYQELEGPRQVYSQLRELCRQWLKPEKHTKEQIMELIIKEQLLAMLPPEVQSWVQERGPEDCVETVALAEDFLLGRRHMARPWDWQEPLNVKEEPDLNQKPTCWALEQQKAGRGTSSNASEGLIPPPETISQLGQQEAIFPPRPENGEPFPTSPLGSDISVHFLALPPGDRMLSQIKTENSQEGDSETDDSFDFADPFTEETSQNIDKDQPPPGGNLHQRMEYQGTSSRGVEDPGKNSDNSLPLQGTQLDSLEHSTDIISLSPAIFEPDPISRLHLRKPDDEDRAPSLQQGVKTLRVVLTKLTGSRKGKTHRCLECGYKTEKYSDLKNHTRIHSRARPYKCHECGRSFRWQWTLHQHKQNACPQKRPVFSASFAEHQATQTGERESRKEAEIKLEDETFPDESCSYEEAAAEESMDHDEELINTMAKGLHRGGSKSYHRRQPPKSRVGGQPPKSRIGPPSKSKTGRSSKSTHRKKRRGRNPKKAREENTLPKKTNETTVAAVFHGDSTVLAMIRERWRYDKQEQKKDEIEETNETVEEANDNVTGKEAAVRARLEKFAYCKGADADQGPTELSSDNTAQAGEKRSFK